MLSVSHTSSIGMIVTDTLSQFLGTSREVQKLFITYERFFFTYHMVMNFVQGMISNFLLNPGFSFTGQVPYNYYSV